MKKNTRQLKLVYSSLVFFLLAILIGFLVTGYRTTNDYREAKQLWGIELADAQITVDDGEPEKIGESIQLAEIAHEVVITGELQETIAPNERWMMEARFFHIVIRCNGEVIYDNQMDKRQHAPYMEIIYGWDGFTTKGIEAGSQIEITATGTVDGVTEMAVNDMYHSMVYGQQGSLIRQVWRVQRGPTAHGVVIITIGMCMMIYFGVGVFFKVHGIEQGITLGFLIVVTGFWYLSEVANELLALLNTDIAMVNYMCYGIAYVVPLAFSLYAAALAKDSKLKEVLYGFCSMTMNYNAMVAVLIIFGRWKLYEWQWSAILVAGFTVLCWVFVGMEAWMLKEKATAVIFATLIPGLTGGILQTIQYIGNFDTYHAFFAKGMLISLVLQMAVLVMRISWIKRRENHMQLVEKELTEKRMTIMISQIQPHFMFNALGTIKRLYEKDMDTAKKAMEAFTKYLRSNIDSLSRTELISFETEKSHLDNYFFLEKLRFQERVNLVYDTKYEDFFLPALTLQPIVENAIKHGITERREGGTIWLTTELIGEEVRITVQDNGVGFAKNEPTNDGRVHVGVENVRSRVENMCHGTFQIESEVGRGTRVTITLPNQRT